MAPLSLIALLKSWYENHSGRMYARLPFEMRPECVMKWALAWKANCDRRQKYGGEGVRYM